MKPAPGLKVRVQDLVVPFITILVLHHRVDKLHVKRLIGHVIFEACFFFSQMKRLWFSVEDVKRIQ